MKCKNVLLMGMILLSAGLFSCSKSSSYSTPPPPVMNVQVAASTSLGNILTDSAGRTLYFFSLDADGSSACTGACLTTWPVFHTGALNPGTGLDAKDFGTITRADGAIQTTYKGWPLYYYAMDSKAGDVNGEGVGNIWFVGKPDYTVMLVKAQLIGLDGISYDSTYHPGTGAYEYLTDDHGLTLYSFSLDKQNMNNYTAADFSNDAVWPIYQVTPTIVAPSTMEKALFGTITVFGKTQLTFKGWPLYYFGADAGVRGSNKGVSVPMPGIWPVANQYSSAAPQ